MPHDISGRFEIIHPTVPHYLSRIEGILGHAHGVYEAAHAIVVGRTAMALRVAEHYFRTATVNLRSRAGALQPVVIPASYLLNDKLIVVMIVRSGRRIAVERAVTFLMVGVAP